MSKLPNILTVSRIVLTPLFLYFIYKQQFPYALILFFVAVITDIFDGVIARRNKQISNFGKIADPLADKIITNSTFFLLSYMGYYHWIWPVIILARELLVTGLRTYYASNDIVIPADKWGKIKTISQFVTIGAYIFSGIVQIDFITQACFFLLMISVFLTFSSGLNYFLKSYKHKSATT